MGNLVTETPYSEITATLEKLDRLGVKRHHLSDFRRELRLARTTAALLTGGLRAITTQEAEEEVKPALKIDKRMQLKLGKLLTEAIYEAGLSEDQITEVFQGWDLLRDWLTSKVTELVPPLVVHAELQLEVDDNTPVSKQLVRLFTAGTLKRSHYGGGEFTDFPDPMNSFASTYYLVHPKREVEFKEAQELIRRSGYAGVSLRELCAFVRLAQASAYRDFNGVTAFGTLYQGYVLFVHEDNNTWQLWTRAAGFGRNSLFLVRKVTL